MSKLVLFRKIVLLAALTVSFNCFSKDLGNLSVTYPIIETDLVALIKSKIAEKEKNGEVALLQKKLKQNVISYVNRPPGVRLPRAGTYRAVELNPTYTVPYNIVDAEGKVIYLAGTQVNPLDVKPLTKMFCFFDGDDPEQVKWVESHCQDNPRNKLILVNGDYRELSEKMSFRIYFDQHSVAVKRFGIQALPAVVRQSGRVLYVEEFPL